MIGALVPRRATPVPGPDVLLTAPIVPGRFRFRDPRGSRVSTGPHPV